MNLAYKLEDQNSN